MLYISDATTGQRRVPQTRIWNVERLLGKGGFGEVRLETRDEEKRAVKRIWETGMTFKVAYERELKALLEFSKPKYKESAVFVGFLGWFQDPESVYLAMEYVPLGDLEDNVVKMGGKIGEGEVKEIAVQILEGLKIMHLESFVHRDLKPKSCSLTIIRNVLVCRGSPEWWVKLADFGLSKRRTEDTAFRTQTGTQAYMAPEILNYIPGHSEYTYAVDIWALGCILYRLTTGTVPFPPGLSLTSFCVDESKFPQKALHISDSGKEFIRKLIVAHPSKRLTSEEALDHEWTKPGKLSRLLQGNAG
ncbi:kinase-like protein [Cadophora sp. DSE1049]|nr:kinase-like protein [Cadophora sp. DSE1049]